MTLGSIQTPDCKTLDNMGKNLVDWYSSYLISRKDKIQNISRTVVADALQCVACSYQLGQSGM